MLSSMSVSARLRSIHARGRRATIAPDMRVMFITGFAAVALRSPDRPANAKILSKPFHLRDLVLEVDRIFRVGTATELS